MIKVTVELISANGRARDRVLGVAFIGNDGKGSESYADYVFDFHTVTRQGNRRRWKAGKVLGFPRKRLLGWDLVQWCLNAAVGSTGRK